MTPRKILRLSILFFVLALVLLIVFLLTGTNNAKKEQGSVFEDNPTAAVKPVASVVNTPDQTAEAEILIQNTPQAQETLTAYSYPDSFYITHISGHRQAYSLGCEAATAVDWAGYFDVPIIEYNFQVALPHSDNPDYGFVGDVNSLWGQIPPYAYGVNSGPVADLLISYGLPAKSVKGYTLDEVKQKLSESKPIIAWVIGKMEWSPAETYIDSEGRSVTVAAYEHVVILTGYDTQADTIRFMSNGVFYDVPTQTFMTSWGVLGNMAVIYDTEAAQ